MLPFFRLVMTYLAKWICRRPLAIFLGALILTGVSAYIATTRWLVINDTDSLIKQTSEVNRTFLEYQKEFGASDEFVFVIRSSDADLNRQAVDELGKRLRALEPSVKNVMDKHDFSRLQDRSLLMLDKTQLLDIEQQIHDQANVLRQQNVHFDLNSMLDQANSKFNDKYLRKASNWNEFKPFIDQFIMLLNSLADELENRKPAKPTQPGPTQKNQAGDAAHAQMIDMEHEMQEHKYNSFLDGQMMLVIAEPGPLPPGESSYGKVIAKLRAIQKDLHAQMPSVTIGLTGEPVLDDDQLQTSSNDSMVAGILAFILVSLLYFLSYRAITRPALALLVLAMGVAISLGYAMVAVGHLNLISTAFVAMVVGLGIDFGIQIMGRYEEELAHGRSLEQAVETTLQHTGLAIITGGSTTAVAFFTMCFNDFIGLAEFGVIAGGGILICLLLSLIVLPSLYILSDRSRSFEKVQLQAQASNWSAWSNLNDGLVRHPRTVIGLAIILTLVAILGWPRLSFDYNLLHLQDQKLESVKEVQAMADSPAGSLITAYSVADNLEQARERIAKFEALPSVKSTASVVDFFPTDTEAKLVIIRQIVDSLRGLNLKTDVKSQIDVEKSRTELTQLLSDSQQGQMEAQKYLKLANAFKDPRAKDAIEVFSKLIPPIQRALDAMSKLSQEEIGKRLYRYQLENLDVMRSDLEWLSNMATDRGIQPDDIPEDIHRRYLSSHGKFLIEIFPKENIWDREPDVRFVNELRSVDPNVTGPPVQNYEYIDLLRKSYVQAAWYSFAAIVLLIGLHFRQVGYTLLTILPLALAVIWTLGLMAWFQISFNPANIVTLPLVIGIGVAYGVYTVDRYREDGCMQLFSTSTGKAITLSALTAIIGFGSMMISSYQGLHSLGVVMSLGVSMCLINCMVVLPQILQLMSLRRKT